MLTSIVPIVEGKSEVESVPVIMRRLLSELGAYEVKIERPFRVNRYRVVKEGELERAIALAKERPGCRAIVVLLDADEDCPKKLASSLRERARQAALDCSVSVVLAKQELESWFIASTESLRGSRGIKDDAAPPLDPEVIPGAKEWLSRNMEAGRRYVPVIDQPAFAECFDFKLAHAKCRSFRKFQKNFEAIVTKLVGET